ncbi:MAG: MtrB/PioB family outer membrane beta-barrel protein, partial [Planctomycetes bacterium]|nr:MtrB/PioB family outer membrane beta-barrel protein [Planctomycetota bacterium]
QGLSNTDRAAKYLEYRDEPVGVVAPWVELRTISRPDDDYWFKLVAKDAAQDDGRLGWEFGRYAVFSVRFTWDRILHRYGTGGRTLYGGIGGNHLILPDTLQATLQAAGTGAAGLAAFRSANAAASDVDDALKVQRDILTLRGEFVQLEPVRLYTELRYEERDGTRPIAGNFGHGHFDEILEPRDAYVLEAETGVSYAREDLDARLFYRFSFFENRHDHLEWDNPFRLTDVVGTSSRGRMALDPSNLSHTVGLQAGVNLPARTRVTAAATATWSLSENELEPYTVNSAVAIPAASGGGRANDPSRLPDRDFDGAINTQQYALTVTSHPVSPLDLRAVARHRRQNDDSERITFPGYVPFDGNFRTLLIENERYEYDKTATGLDAGYRVPALRTRFSTGYGYELWERHDRDVDRVEEHTVRAGAETEWTHWLKSKVGYAQSRRLRGTLDDPVPNEFPNLERFDWSKRIRQKPTASVTLTPADDLSVAVQYALVLDNYPVDFGRRDAKGQEVSLDVGYTPSERVSLSPFLAYSSYSLGQKNRQWAAAVSNPYTIDTTKLSFSNWTALDTGDTYTVGLTTHVVLAPERWSVDVDYVYATNRSDIHLDSPIGSSAAQDANLRVPRSLIDAENSDRHTVNARLDYSASKRLSFTLGYTFDSFRTENFYDRGLIDLPTSSSGGFFAYLLEHEFEDADVHVFSLTATYKF